MDPTRRWLALLMLSLVPAMGSNCDPLPVDNCRFVADVGQVCVVDGGTGDGGRGRDGGYADGGWYDSDGGWHPLDAGQHFDGGWFDSDGGWHADDAGVPVADAGDVDAGDVDAGDVDAGDVDAGDVDAGDVDAGDVDAGPVFEQVQAVHFRAGAVAPAAFVAFRDGPEGQPWRVLTSVDGHYTLDVGDSAGQYGVLFACESADQSKVELRQYELTTAEGLLLTNGCDFPRSEQSAFHSFSYDNVPEGVCPKTLTSGVTAEFCNNYVGLADRTVDLAHVFFTGGSGGGSTGGSPGVAERLYFTRDVTTATLPTNVDYLASVQTLPQTLSVLVEGDWLRTSYLTANGTPIDLPAQTGSVVVDARAVPPALARPDDLHVVDIGDFGTHHARFVASAAFPARVYLPAGPVATPTTTALSTSPVRLAVDWTPAHPDDVGHRLSFRNGSGSIRWSVLSSIDAHGGSGGGTLHRWSMPSLESLPGWRAEWELATGSSSEFAFDSIQSSGTLGDAIGPGTLIPASDDGRRSSLSLRPSAAQSGLILEFSSTYTLVAY